MKFRRHFVHFLLNVGCLSLGLGSSAIIFSYYSFEKSYDQFFPDSNNIYRIAGSIKGGVAPPKMYASTPYPLAETVKAELRDPEIESVRLFRYRFGDYPIRYKDKTFSEKRFFFTDPTFFKVFHHQFLFGSPDNAFKNPYSVVITSSIAKKYFGDENPLGKTLEIINRNLNMEVTGVIEDLPANTHFQFDFLTYREMNSMDWTFRSAWTYIKLPSHIARHRLDAVLEGIAHKYFPVDNTVKLWAQALETIHLQSNLDDELGQNNDHKFVSSLLPVGCALAAIAAINFIILLFAHGIKRRKEIGLRKIIGASNLQLFSYLFRHSTIIAITSIIIATVSIVILNQQITALFNIPLARMMNPQLIAQLVAGAMGTGLIAAILPSFFLSQTKPILNVQNLSGFGDKFSVFKMLVTFQFVIAITFIISSVAVFKQLEYILKGDKGINYGNTVLINIPWQLGNVQSFSMAAFKSQLMSQEGIQSLTVTTQIPWREQEFEPFRNPELAEDNYHSMHIIFADSTFAKTFQLDVLRGRHLNKSAYILPDSAILFECMVNESAWKTLQLGDDPLGKTLDFNYDGTNNFKAVVTGVVRDFNLQPVFTEIKPLAMVSHFPSSAASFGYMAIKIKGNLQDKMTKISQVYSQQSGGWPLEYYFLDDAYEQLYKKEAEFGNILALLTILIIIVSTIGLFSITIIAVQKKKRELAIRKILGAKSAGLFLLLNIDYIKIISIAFIIGAPIAFLYYSHWLQQFAYQVNIGIEIFVIIFILVIIFTVLINSVNVFKGINLNPLQEIKE